MTNYLYICDGNACDKPCYGECQHTSDESHAKNKVRRNRKFNMIKEKSGRITMWEVQNDLSI